MMIAHEWKFVCVYKKSDFLWRTHGEEKMHFLEVGFDFDWIFKHSSNEFIQHFKPLWFSHACSAQNSFIQPFNLKWNFRMLVLPHSFYSYIQFWASQHSPDPPLSSPPNFKHYLWCTNFKHELWAPTLIINFKHQLWAPTLSNNFKHQLWAPT